MRHIRRLINVPPERSETQRDHKLKSNLSRINVFMFFLAGSMIIVHGRIICLMNKVSKHDVCKWLSNP